MVGKDCVGIACDKRLGLQAMTISKDFPKIFPFGTKILLGLSGLASDIQTFRDRLTFDLNTFTLREERQILPKEFSHLVSSSLYSKRFGPFFVEPIIAGMNYNIEEKTWSPYICSMDLIGCINWAKDFVVSGTASNNLYGLCECLYEPDMVLPLFIGRIPNNYSKPFHKLSLMDAIGMR